MWLSALDAGFGSQRWGFRLGALAAAGLALVLFGRLSERLFRRPGPALVAALLVAVHPVGIESIQWIAGLSGPLCAAFVIAALGLGLAAFRAPAPGRAAALAAGSAAALGLALLSKERAAVEPALLLAALLSAARIPGLGAPSRALARAAGLLALHAAVVAAVFGVWRPAVLGAVVTPLPPIGGSAATQLASAAASWPASLGWLFFPLHSTTNDGVRIVGSFADPGAVLGVALALGSLVAWLALLRSGRPVAALGIAWVWIAFLPTAGLLPLLHPRGERYLFLSAFGAALLVVDLARGLGAKQPSEVSRRVAPALAALLVVLLAQRTFSRLPAWRSTATLFEIEVARDPDYREGRYLLAAARLEAGRPAEADALLAPLVTPLRRPETAGYVNLLAVYELACANELALGRYDRALALERRMGPAIASMPALQLCFGEAREGLGQPGEALPHYLATAEALGPATPPRLALRIARTYAELGRRGRARRWLERAKGDPALAGEIEAVRAALRRR